MVLNIVNGNFGLVKSWQKSPRPVGASVLFVPFGPTLSHTLKPNWKGPKRLAQLDNWLDTKGKTYKILCVRNIIVKWCMWVYVTLKFFLCNQLRVHTSWAIVELEWRLKVFPSASIFVLKFTASRYALLYLNSEIYIGHVIDCEWSRSV